MSPDRNLSGAPLEVIGDFEVIGSLGQGGMGTVYRARQISLDRQVALKILPMHYRENADYLARFQRESRLAAGLSHPNLVKVFSSGDVSGCHYFAMELVEGESLSQLLRREALPPLKALRILLCVAWALEYGWRMAHLIHRDIKPGNIFLSPNGDVKLGDLGLAKTVGGESTELTVTGVAMGTPHYISPEQARGYNDLDIRTDIYSLGCTLYHMLTGQPPFRGSDPLVVMNQHINAPPPAILKVLPQCPIPLARLVAQMMKKSRRERISNYEELIASIETVCGQLDPTLAAAPLPAASVSSGPSASMVMPSQSRRRPMESSSGVSTSRRNARPSAVAISVAVGIVVLAIVGFFLWLMQRPASVETDLQDQAAPETTAVSPPGLVPPVATRAPITPASTAENKVAALATVVAPISTAAPITSSLKAEYKVAVQGAPAVSPPAPDAPIAMPVPSTPTADNKVAKAVDVGVRTTTAPPLAKSPPVSNFLDPAFGKDGVVSTTLGLPDTWASGVGVQRDGKILVAGYANGKTSLTIGLVRYTPNGELDRSFNGAGKVTTSIGGTGNSVTSSLAVLRDGRILVALGHFMVRYNTDGSVDSTFGAAGRIHSNAGSIWSLAVQPDGKIVTAGFTSVDSQNIFAVARYQPDGRPDTSFNRTGWVTTRIGNGADISYSVALQGDGKIVVAGYTTLSTIRDRAFAVVRYNTDGSLDTSFNGTGIVTTDFTDQDDEAHCMALQSDGKIILTGFYSGRIRNAAVARYNLDGSLDTTFNGTGKVAVSDGPYANAFGVVPLTDDRIVVAGTSKGAIVLRRYLANGLPDPTLNGSGGVVTAFGHGGSDYANAIALQKDGKILVVGRAQNDGADDFVVVRYLANTGVPQTTPAPALAKP
ncbi:MAG TPA: protein kinase [Chthoniobacter sp.]|jgi:uncharacterized delta-60 repeat protein